MTNTVEIETMCFVYQLKPGMVVEIAGERSTVQATQLTDCGMIVVTYDIHTWPGMTMMIYLGKFESVKLYDTFVW